MTVDDLMRLPAHSPAWPPREYLRQRADVEHFGWLRSAHPEGSDEPHYDVTVSVIGDARGYGNGSVSMATHLFAYGSLLHPGSVRRTLPHGAPGEGVGAHLSGYARTYSVAFPNDGSQSDKSYVDAAGNRPPFVLFANLVARGDTLRTNGVLLPLSEGDLDLLVIRERRYELVDVTTRVCPVDPSFAPPARVVTFIGSREFTSPAHVARGVLSREYLRTIHAGVQHWNRLHSGFAADYRRSTLTLAGARVVDLVRVGAERPVA